MKLAEEHEKYLQRKDWKYDVIPFSAMDYDGHFVEYIRDFPHMTLYPGLAIMFTILALNFLGDGLRDALDPKLKR